MSHKDFVIGRIESLVKHSNDVNAKIIGMLEEVKAGNCHRFTVEEAITQIKNMEKAQIELNGHILADLESAVSELLA